MARRRGRTGGLPARREEFHGLPLASGRPRARPRPDTRHWSTGRSNCCAANWRRSNSRPWSISDGQRRDRALAVKHACPSAALTATDASGEAERRPKTQHAARLAVEFRRGAWWEAVARPFPPALSNPPYIPSRSAPGGLTPRAGRGVDARPERLDAFAHHRPAGPADWARSRRLAAAGAWVRIQAEPSSGRLLSRCRLANAPAGRHPRAPAPLVTPGSALLPSRPPNVAAKFRRWSPAASGGLPQAGIGVLVRHQRNIILLFAKWMLTPHLRCRRAPVHPPRATA